MTETRVAEPPAPANAEERVLLDQAVRLASAGQMDGAEATVADLIGRNPNLLEAHDLRGKLAFHRRRPGEAVAAYAACVALHPAYVPFHFNLATAREMSGDLAGAIDAYLEAWRRDPRDARIALFAGSALEAAGRREDATTMYSLGDDIDPGARVALEQARGDPGLAARAATADRAIREHFTRLHADSVDRSEQASKPGDGGEAPDLSRVRGGLWTQTHAGPVAFRTPLQQPSIFYMPDLPARPITPRETLAWARAVEAATAEIRAEYLAVVEGGARFSPYVTAKDQAPPSWDKLRGQLDWSSIHLFKGAEETAFARLFPKTLKALEAADVVRMDDGRPIEMFFSRLKPGAHIPPHFGCANNRLTVHLPLIIPSDCAIRVGEEIHVWREGELFAFDDSFEHEAWNRSPADRVVLIFESHHPDLSQTERAAIERAFADRGRWLRERRAPAPGGA